MKKVFLTLWVALLTASVWVGCGNKGGGGGGGGGGNNLATILQCTSNHTCSQHQVYQAMSACTTYAQQRYVDPSACASVGGGGCISLAEYFSYAQSGQLQMYGLPSPQIQNINCSTQSECSSYAIQASIGPWSTYVGSTMQCRPDQRSSLVNQLVNMASQFATGHMNGNGYGYGNMNYGNANYGGNYQQQLYYQQMQQQMMMQQQLMYRGW